VFAAQIKFALHQGRGGAEGVIEMIHGQSGVFAIVPKNDGIPVAASDVDTAARADR